MALQEMPEKFEDETEEPTEAQESTVVSSSPDSDEDLASVDSAPVEDSLLSVVESADQSTLETDSVPASGTSSDNSDIPAAEEFLIEESNTTDQPSPETNPAPEAETSSDDSSVPTAEESAWYVIHCYSGYENKVRHNLEQRIETMGMKDKIFDVVIPTQEEIEVKDGKRRTVERHIFPGYVLVNLELSEESWYVVRNTPGVTGFVGMGNTPTPLRPEEVSQIIKRMEADAPTVKVTYKVGERVRIVDGPFNDFRGIVAEIDMERTKVRVNVSFFGRETPVELDFLQVEKA